MVASIRAAAAMRRMCRRHFTSYLLSTGLLVGIAAASEPAATRKRPQEGSLIVNLNTASTLELESIPGIGPALASLIIAGRPYKSVDELVRISGISVEKLRGMKPFMKLQGPTEPR